MSLDNTTLESLRNLQGLIGAANADKGFHEEGELLRASADETLRRPKERLEMPLASALRNYYVARLALITTEVAEAIEELRSGVPVDETYYTKGGATYGDRVAHRPADAKPEGVPSELADVVIRAFDFADEAGIDLAAMIDEKLAYNATRPFKHGRTF